MILFSKNLSYLRKIYNLRQSELALRIGMKTNTISNYENGKSLPDFNILKNIIKIFDVSSDDILYKDLEITGYKTGTLKSIINEPEEEYKKEDRTGEQLLINMLDKKDATISELNRKIGKLEEQLKKENPHN